MVGEASGRMQKADCRDEIALPAAMLAWLKYRKQRTRNSRKRFLVFFCSLFVKARVVYRLRYICYKLFEYRFSLKIAIKDIFLVIRNIALMLLVLILFDNNALYPKPFHMTLNPFNRARDVSIIKLSMDFNCSVAFFIFIIHR